jgi:acetolactate synthase-1/2/3 large subunit
VNNVKDLAKPSSTVTAVTGAESLIRTLIGAGFDVCFANPGTTELPMVRALDEVEGMRAVLCLFEGVCTGAADGYARMAGKPGLTLLHLGPGFANGIAYLHDARRARSPIVNLVGDHATWHLAADAPLTSDIESLARPVSAWVRTSRSASALAADAVDAVVAAHTAPGQIATLIVPHDYQLAEVSGAATLRAAPPPPLATDAAIARARELLRRSGPAVLFLGGYALGERGLRAAARVAAATGCALMCETFPARWERGAGTPSVTRLPYFPDQGIAALSRFESIVLAGARPPVAFFGYPGLPSLLIAAEQQQTTLATPDEDVPAALEALADGLGAPRDLTHEPASPTVRAATGKLKPETLSAAVASMIPDHAIVMDESNTSMGPFLELSQSSARHTVLTQPGGAIGLGPPCATGAAIACPDRVVINLQADGSAMYTLQALWTQAREQLNVVTIICNNRGYRILGIEMARASMTAPGRQAKRLLGLSDPAIDWVSLARGMGVPGARVETGEELTLELGRALSAGGPRLIEAVVQ